MNMSQEFLFKKSVEEKNLAAVKFFVESGIGKDTNFWNVTSSPIDKSIRNYLNNMGAYIDKQDFYSTLMIHYDKRDYSTIRTLFNNEFTLDDKYLNQIIAFLTFTTTVDNLAIRKNMIVGQTFILRYCSNYEIMDQYHIYAQNVYASISDVFNGYFNIFFDILMKVEEQTDKMIEYIKILNSYFVQYRGSAIIISTMLIEFKAVLLSNTIEMIDEYCDHKKIFNKFLPNLNKYLENNISNNDKREKLIDEYVPNKTPLVVSLKLKRVSPTIDEPNKLTKTT